MPHLTKSLKHIVVTGGAGTVGYSLLFRIASGEMLGIDQPVALHILDLPSEQKSLLGIQMELEDCAFPLLKEIHIGSNPHEIFQNADLALLVGSKPRTAGMQRSDLLQDNGRIFIEQGKALNDVAHRDVKVLVVGNPCNSNCWIAMSNAPRIPRTNFHALMRLDQNRAAFQLAHKAKAACGTVSNVTIWGNHSITQVPDFYNARIGGKPVPEVIHDRKWLEEEFIPLVQNRGAAILAARGKSSAASATQGIIDAVKALYLPTPAGQWFSSAVCSDGNPYGIEEDLIFSFPCRSKGDGSYEIVKDVPWNAFLKQRIALTQKELLEERGVVSAMR